jgi:hypothetical protein
MRRQLSNSAKKARPRRLTQNPNENEENLPTLGAWPVVLATHTGDESAPRDVG